MGRKPAKTAQERLKAKLEDYVQWLCVEWGFCGDAPVDLARESWSADEFAEAILRAEGMGELETHYRKKIRDEFIRRFGSSLSLSDFE